MQFWHHRGFAFRDPPEGEEGGAHLCVGEEVEDPRDIVGDAQGEPSTAPRVPADEAAKIDRVLGIMPVSARMGYGDPDPTTGARRFHTMTPAQARAAKEG